MKRYKNILLILGVLGTLVLNEDSLGILDIHGETVKATKESDVKYKDNYIQSINLGDKVCYYCIFSSNEDVSVLIDDITYKGSNVTGVQNYRLDNVPKLRETDDKSFDRYNVEDNEYAFIKFKDVMEEDKNVYVYFAQMPLGVNSNKFKESEYIVNVGEPTFNDFETTKDGLKYKYYDGHYAEGWQNIDNNIYYFNKDTGLAQKGWMEDKVASERVDWYYFDEEYKMVTGFQEIEGKQYWFSDNGKMLVNTTAPDGITIDENGVYLEETESEQ